MVLENLRTQDGTIPIHEDALLAKPGKGLCPDNKSRGTPSRVKLRYPESLFLFDLVNLRR
jgi:hypothetical protein